MDSWHDVGRFFYVTACYVAVGSASFAGWRLVQLVWPRWRDAYGSLAPLSTCERRRLYLVRLVGLFQIFVSSGAIASIFFAPFGLPLLLWSWRGWLDAGRLLRRHSIRGSYLEIGSYTMAVLIVGTVIGAGVAVHDDLDRANLLGALTVVPLAWVAIDAYVDVARIAARRTAPSARQAVGASA